MDPLAIANLALGWLGAEPIASLEDATRTAQLVNNAFSGLRDAVLEDRDWTFATDRRSLPADATSPAWGYTTRFLLPSAVLRVITCSNAGTGGTLDAFAASMMPWDDGSLEWVREGPYILAGRTGTAQAGGSQIPAINVKSIISVLDSALWSPGFCQALAARVAAELAVPIAQSRELQGDMWKLYLQKLKDAAANDGRQGRSERVRADTISRSRR